MDRDHRWERVERGYDAIVHGVGTSTPPSATAAIEAAYARGENDEFVTPTVIDGAAGADRAGEPIIHANFRADRARQLIHALADAAAFDGFDRRSPTGRAAPDDLLVVTMTEYEAGLPVEVAFPPEEARSLAQAFSEAGWRQFHVAETEKYAHVTYFFNGGVEAPYPGEERLLVPSPKVATYDLQPEMSAVGVTDALVEAIGSGRFDFIVANFANPDMVGHTGVWDATLAALDDDRRAASPGSSPRSTRSTPTTRTRPGRSSRSPPTTATPTTCATPTGTRSPPTRSTRCRSSWSGGRLAVCASRTACWPTSRRPCSSSPACRAGTG